MKNYRESFKKLIEEIKSNKKIDLLELEFNSEIDINRVLELNNNPKFPNLPKDIYEFYSNIGNSLKIYWSCNIVKNGIKPFENDESDTVYGKINILPLENFGIKNPKVNSKKYYKNFDKDELTDIPQFRLIEEWSDVVNIGFIINKKTNRVVDELYYLDSNSDGFGFPSINFKNYIDAIIKYKGFSGWQHSFLFKNLERENYYLKNIFK
ncbi:hypothetical protein JXR93_10475 [bacterium]|nr:hypothetical protein [bacterium]